SPLMNMGVAALCYAAYLALTVYVSINAHLKSEFRLTYAKLGPTEFRLIIIVVNALLVFFPGLLEFSLELCGHPFSTLDLVAMGLIAVLALIYLVTVFADARHYAAIDPPRK
ncbi:MAG: CDP-alcohol phosphatidyltransferase, partial [Bacteroidaceae bacterium]|nr:CDP-alcohol phosphatidyltransferase [Bacteroidaceae bacterium]